MRRPRPVAHWTCHDCDAPSTIPLAIPEPSDPPRYCDECLEAYMASDEVREALRNVPWAGYFVPQPYSYGLKEISVTFALPLIEDNTHMLIRAEAAALDRLKQVTDLAHLYVLRGVIRTS